MTISTSIRCSEELRASAAEVAEFYGFDLSSVTRSFWRQMSRTKTIPLDFEYGNRFEGAWASSYEAETDLETGAILLPNEWENELD